MSTTTETPTSLVFTILPGPDRKRSATPYAYRVTYRGGPGPGCVRLWSVLGGRMPYQIALERDDAGALHFHCTCADAVYRAENEGRYCKHVQGLLEITRTAAA